jgi:hypothetical protein
MLWFVTVEAVKEKPVSPTDILNRWHQVALSHMLQTAHPFSVFRHLSSVLCTAAPLYPITWFSVTKNKRFID